MSHRLHFAFVDAADSVVGVDIVDAVAAAAVGLGVGLGVGGGVVVVGDIDARLRGYVGADNDAVGSDCVQPCLRPI